jgi:hypothetical protein
VAEYITADSKREKTTDVMLEKIQALVVQRDALIDENADLKKTLSLYMALVDRERA